MKMKSFVIGTVMTTGLLAGGANLTLADSDSDRLCDRDGKQHTGGKYQKSGMQPMQRLMSKLELDQTQRDQIQAIVASQGETLREQRQAMREIRHKLHQVATDDDYDAAQVRQLAEEKARLASEITVQRSEMMQRIFQQLTPQQRTKFESMRERYRHHKS